LGARPARGADWKAIDASHGPGYPKNPFEEAMDTPSGALVRICFHILNAKSIGLTITLADITEEEFRVLELIEAERREQIQCEGNGTLYVLPRHLSRAGARGGVLGMIAGENPTRWTISVKESPYYQPEETGSDPIPDEPPDWAK
jgi:hypothetical protein